MDPRQSNGIASKPHHSRPSHSAHNRYTRGLRKETEHSLPLHRLQQSFRQSQHSPHALCPPQTWPARSPPVVAYRLPIKQKIPHRSSHENRLHPIREWDPTRLKPQCPPACTVPVHRIAPEVARQTVFATNSVKTQKTQATQTISQLGRPTKM